MKLRPVLLPHDVPAPNNTEDTPESQNKLDTDEKISSSDEVVNEPLTNSNSAENNLNEEEYDETNNNTNLHSSPVQLRVKNNSEIEEPLPNIFISPIRTQSPTNDSVNLPIPLAEGRTWCNPSVDPLHSPGVTYPVTRLKSNTSEREIEVLPVIAEEIDNGDYESLKSYSSIETIKFLRRKSKISTPVRSRTSGMSIDSLRAVSWASGSIYYSAENIPFSVEENNTILRNSVTPPSPEEPVDLCKDKLLQCLEVFINSLSMLKEYTYDFVKSNLNLYKSKYYLLCCLSSSSLKVVSHSYQSVQFRLKL